MKIPQHLCNHHPGLQLSARTGREKAGFTPGMLLKFLSATRDKDSCLMSVVFSQNEERFSERWIQDT